MSRRVPGTLHLPATEITLAAAEGDGESSVRRFTGTAYTGSKVEVNGWPYPIVVDLSGMKVSKKPRPILRDHQRDQIVGHTETIEVSPRSVYVEGLLSGANAHAQEVIAASDSGFPWQMSIGPRVTKAVFLEDGEVAVVNGRKVSGPCYLLRETTLQEISFVALGADDNTSASVAASAASTTIGVLTMKFDAWLTEKGFGDGAELSEKQLATLKAAFDKESAPPETAAPSTGSASLAASTATLDEIVETQRKNKERCGAITKLASQFISERPGMVDQIDALARLAIAGTDSPDAFELKVRRELLPATGGITGRRSDTQLNGRVIEAALCSNGKLADIEKKFDQQTLELAEKHYPNGIGLAELILMAARENGCTHLSVNNTREVLMAAFLPEARLSAFSTISLPGILSNVANKFLVDAFNAVESEWRKITAMRSVRNFQQVTSYSLTGGFTYESLGPSGELKHATVGQETYTNQADTYGKIFSITRRDIINDDLGAFAAIPRKLGRGGALKINEVFWATFLNNLAFFTTSRDNFDNSAGTAFSAESLANADVMFRMQTDPDGQPLGAIPKILLVPPALRVPAMRLMNSTLTARDTDAGSSNPFAGMFSVVSSQYMANASYTGSSSAAWYLLADPNDIPVIETAFLGGREAPIVESADADFNTLGIQIRAYHDFGVSLQEYRGGVRFDGTPAEET